MFPEGRALEFLIAAVVALIVVGPKDLPILLRKFGQFMAKLRGMAAEFRASFDEMARQSELDELRKEVEALRNTRMSDPLGAQSTFHEIDQSLRSPAEAKAEAEFWAEQGRVGSESHPVILPPDAQPVPEEAPAPAETSAEAQTQPEPGTRLP
jgi:sec-independent protein translocase protein TatB